MSYGVNNKYLHSSNNYNISVPTYTHLARFEEPFHSLVLE